MAELDLNELVRNHKLDLSIVAEESEEEKGVRVRAAEAQTIQDLKKDMILFWAVLLGMTAICALCVWFVVAPDSSPADEKWGMTILTSVVAGGLGYLTGKGKRA